MDYLIYMNTHTNNETGGNEMNTITLMKRDKEVTFTININGTDTVHTASTRKNFKNFSVKTLENYNGITFDKYDTLNLSQKEIHNFKVMIRMHNQNRMSEWKEINLPW